MVQRDKYGNPKSWTNFYMSHFELWPLVGITALALAFYACSVTYILKSRVDVEWYRGQAKQFPRDLTNPQPGRLFLYNTKFPPNPKLAQIYRDMDQKEEELKKKKKK